MGYEGAQDLSKHLVMEKKLEGVSKVTGKALAVRWKGLIRSNKSPTFLVMIKRRQKESMESSLGVTPSISPITQMGWATRPPSSTVTPLRDIIRFFLKEAGIASVVPSRAEPRCVCGKRQSLPCCSPDLCKHIWHGAPGITALFYFYLVKHLERGAAGSVEQWKSHPQPSPGLLSLAQEGAGRCEMAMKHLHAHLGLTHEWKTAMERSVVEDGAVLPFPTSAKLSWKFFFKIIQHKR